MTCNRVSIHFWGVSATRPFAGREPPCIIITSYNSIVMLDAGEGCQKAFEYFGLGLNRKIVVLISHLHGDHYLGLPALLHTLSLSGRSEELIVVGPPHLRRALQVYDAQYGFPLVFAELWGAQGVIDLKRQAGFTVTYTAAPHIPFSYSFVIKYPDVQHLDPTKLDEAGMPREVRRALIEQGRVAAGGREFRLEDFLKGVDPGPIIAYSGDTLPSAAFIAKAKGADVMIHEATFSETEEKAKIVPHSSSVDAAEAALKAKVKLLVLTHFSTRYKDPERLADEARRIFPRTICAFKGLVIQLSTKTPRSIILRRFEGS
uniref:Ribonuclease Z n=1 Tax=Thermofilum pendens TaxID=2269 RepID=A0A7C1T6R4_THEPE